MQAAQGHAAHLTAHFPRRLGLRLARLCQACVQGRMHRGGDGAEARRKQLRAEQGGIGWGGRQVGRCGPCDGDLTRQQWR